MVGVLFGLAKLKNIIIIMKKNGRKKTYSFKKS